MLQSLNRLKALNGNTKVFCTHEYTAKNIAFALTLEPENARFNSEDKNNVLALRAQQSTKLAQHYRLRT